MCSCVKKKSELTLDSKVMINVVIDLQIAQEMASKYRKNQRDSIKNKYLHEIYSIHKIDSVDLYGNLKIMEDQPEIALKIYSAAHRILDSLGKGYDQKIKQK
jgi:hypothetical protein